MIDGGLNRCHSTFADSDPGGCLELNNCDVSYEGGNFFEVADQKGMT